MSSTDCRCCILYKLTTCNWKQHFPAGLVCKMGSHLLLHFILFNVLWNVALLQYQQAPSYGSNYRRRVLCVGKGVEDMNSEPWKGPLAISLAEMINDFYQFLYLIIIFMVGYGNVFWMFHFWVRAYESSFMPNKLHANTTQKCDDAVAAISQWNSRWKSFQSAVVQTLHVAFWWNVQTR